MENRQNETRNSHGAVAFEGFARFQELSAALSEEIERSLRLWSQTFAAAMEPLADLFENYHERAQQAHDFLLEHGWYLGAWSLTLTEHASIILLAEQGRTDEVSEIIAGIIRRRVGFIREELVRKFPNRAEIFEQAFDAHERGDYGVSIPAMLAQADGIHFEILGFGLFYGGLSRIRREIGSLVDATGGNPYTAWLLLPLGTRSGLHDSVSPQTLEYQPDAMNMFSRHGILHGIITTYHTEMNGLKAIALLDFLACAKPEIEELRGRMSGSDVAEVD